MFTRIHRGLRVVTAIALVAMFAGAASAQDADRIRIFGSLNAGYGKVDNIPVQGLTKKGTTDYRVLSLQFRFTLSETDQFVTQLVSRKVGESVINEANPAIYPVWAYYQHRFNSGAVVKIGRTPLPRGIYNEVRYIGTLLPFYRVGESVYAETLENLDGASIAKSWSAGAWGLEATGFAGGFDLHALLPGSDGKVSLVSARLEKAVGTQLWVNTPLKGVRIGEFAARMEESTEGTNYPYLSVVHSIDGNWAHAFVKAEMTEFRSRMKSERDASYYRGYYALAGVKPTEKFTISAGREGVVRRLDFPAPISPAFVNLDATKEWIGGISYAASSNVTFKFEAHAREGYLWDVAVPIVKPPTKPPLSMTVLPPSKGNFAIASVAITF